jgi:hypothetical protein
LGVGLDPFRVRFFEGAQRFIAGWSSPVARQAHNLKVIGSNPIPATKIDKNPAISMDCWVFVFKVEPSPNKINGLVSQVQITRNQLRNA